MKRLKTDSLECRTLRAECARRGWTTRDLSARTGLSTDCLRHLYINGFAGADSRVRIEQALGMAIFSTPEEFQRRKELAEAFEGQDPFLMRLGELNRLAAQEQVPNRSKGRNNRRVMIELLAEHFRAKARPGAQPCQSSNPQPPPDSPCPHPLCSRS